MAETLGVTEGSRIERGVPFSVFTGIIGFVPEIGTAISFMAKH